MGDDKYIEYLRNSIPKTKGERAEAFHKKVKTVKGSVVEAVCNEMNGSPLHGPIAKAAWAIAIATPKYREYISGELMGTEEAGVCLQRIACDAMSIAEHIQEIAGVYHLESAESEQSSNKRKDVTKMFREDSKHKRKQRWKNCKKQLKFTVRTAFFFSIGSVLTDFPFAIFLGLLFLLDILLTD